jgi:succinate-semialdehyde dehydrogenase/glutarate-semialdehyde dehydrogenase
MTIASVDPATGATLERFEPHDAAEIERRLALAASAFAAWKLRPVAERCRTLAVAARVFEGSKRRLAEIATREMGKTLAAAEAEVAKCSWALAWYAENAQRLLAPVAVDSDARSSSVRFDPLGVVLAVMPWNFPFWQVVRFAAPALAAGNVGLLKHASNVPRCALALEAAFRDAGLPDGCFQTLLVGGEAVAGVIADPRVAAATLTGSEPAGAAVAAAAGASVKKVVLELGGSDPFVVLPSADVARAAEVAVKARTINNGQSCIAAKRFVVHSDVYDEFERRFVDGMRALTVGDPMDRATDVGPLATAAIRDELHAQVRASVAGGGRLLLGGEPASGPGWFYPPTVIADPPAETPAAAEELFGPVAALFRVASLDEAIALANRTPFGLGAAVWTRDESEIERAVTGIEAGSVFVNGMVASDPRLPFGGVKRSGHGRELSQWGLHEFVNVKTVWIGGEPA